MFCSAVLYVISNTWSTRHCFKIVASYSEQWGCLFLFICLFFIRIRKAQCDTLFKTAYCKADSKWQILNKITVPCWQLSCCRWWSDRMLWFFTLICHLGNRMNITPPSSLSWYLVSELHSPTTLNVKGQVDPLNEISGCQLAILKSQN